LEYYIKIFPTKFISLILDKLLNFTNFGRLLQHLNIFKRNYEIEKEGNRPTGPVLAQGLRARTWAAKAWHGPLPWHRLKAQVELDVHGIERCGCRRGARWRGRGRDTRNGGGDTGKRKLEAGPEPWKATTRRLRRMGAVREGAEGVSPAAAGRAAGGRHWTSR
jgi:hypothetical protein